MRNGVLLPFLSHADQATFRRWTVHVTAAFQGPIKSQQIKRTGNLKDTSDIEQPETGKILISSPGGTDERRTI